MATIVKKSAIKSLVQEENYLVSRDFYDALDMQICKIIERAKITALKNKRKTLRPIDLE